MHTTLAADAAEPRPGAERSADWVVAATATAVPALRGLARAVAAGWGVIDEDRALALVVSELVGNAVRHSGGREVRLRLSASPTALTVEVRDTGRWLPPAAQNVADAAVNGEPTAGELACGGRGLQLVRAYATSLTIRRTPAGTRVIAELDLRTAA